MMEPSKGHDSAFYKDIMHIIRSNGVVLPFVVVAVGLLVKFDVLSQAAYLGDLWFACVSIGFILLALVYYLAGTPTPGRYFAFSCVYHLLAILFLIGVSGVFSPFAILWVVLFVGLDSYFARYSLLFSMTLLAIAGAFNLYLHPDITAHDRVGILFTVVFVAVVCILLAKLRAINDRERIDLVNSHDREAFQRDRLITLVNSISDAVISTNEKGIIKVYNASALSLLDTHVDLNNKQFSRYVKLYDEANKKVDLLAKAKESDTGFGRDDVALKFAEGEVVNLSVSISPIRLSYHTRGERGYIFIMRDITKQKSLEEERDEFISVVSHELRTPIAIAEGNVSNVRLLRSKGLPEAAVDKALDQAHQQILYLAKMVNDLSTLSRAERGLDANAEKVDLMELLSSLYRKYNDQATQKGLHLNLDVPGVLPAIDTSRLYLEEILQNLITNAIKYTKTGAITLHGDATKDSVNISVKDTGIGISKSDQKHIFEKFYRSEDYRTRESSGTGLGLYVSKKLATKLRAEITFSSRLNHGSTFTLIVPRED